MPVMFRDRVKVMTDEELAEELSSISRMRGPSKTRRGKTENILKKLSKGLKNMTLEELEDLKKATAEEEQDE